MPQNRELCLLLYMVLLPTLENYIQYFFEQKENVEKLETD